MKRRLRSNEGFTIVEVVIASSILLLVFAGFLISFVQATRMLYMADRHYAASVIARNRIEYAKIYVYGSLSTLAENNVCVDRHGDICSTGTFWRTTSIGTSTANTNCTEMAVSIVYETKPGVTSPVPVEISTLIGD